MACLDDVYIVSQEPYHVGNGYVVVQHDLYQHAKNQVNRGKTKVYKVGVRPKVWDILEQMAREFDPSALVWRGSDGPGNHFGLKVLWHTFWVSQRTSQSNWRSLRPNISNSWTRSQICGAVPHEPVRLHSGRRG